MAAQLVDPYTNQAVRRAQQEANDSILFTDVPINGANGARIALRMTRYACDILATTLNTHGLQQHRAITQIDEVIRAGLLVHEDQNWVPRAEQRAQFIQDYALLADQLATTPEESVEHAHDVSYNMADFDLDLLLANLRLWALCDGRNRIYQIGVINVINEAESSVQLFNTMPVSVPTHTIFFVRTCEWEEEEGVYKQSWAPLATSDRVHPTMPLQRSTDVTSGSQAGDGTELPTEPHADGPAYRKARIHMPRNPHHIPAISYLGRSPEQLLAPGSGVETDEMYGGLILCLGLTFPNHRLRDLISIKRESEENQRPWAVRSNQILHRIRDALQHIFGFDRYEQMLDLYTSARGSAGSDDSKRQWLDILGDAATYDLWAAERCPKCKK